MQFLSDVTVEGVADFLKGASVSKKLLLFDSNTGTSVRIFAAHENLVVGHGDTGAPYTSFYEGDIETCFTKLSDLADRGFLRIGTVDGEPKGVPRQMGEGTPIVYDAVSDSIYAYNRGNARWNQMAGGTRSVGYRSNFIPKWDSAGNLVPSGIEDIGFGFIRFHGRVLPSHDTGTITDLGGVGSDMWSSVYAEKVYTSMSNVPLLGVNEHGQIVPSSSTPGGGGSGNVSTSDGIQGRIPVWKTTLELTNSPLLVDGDDVIPSLSSSTFGNLTNKWSEVFSDEVRLKYTNVPFLGTNNLGQIRRASQTPVTGSGLHDRLVKYIGPSGGSGNVVGQALIEDDGANVSFHGSALPKTGLTLALGSQANPWLALYASSVTLGLTNQSALGTDSDGRIVKGTVPSLPSDIVRSTSGGIDTRLAMFSGTSRNISSSPVSFTGTELVVNDVPLVRNSPGGPDCTLGTSTTKWKGLYVDGIQLGPTMLNKPYLKTDGSGNIVAASAPSGGGGVTGGTANYVARWTGATGLGIGKLFDDDTGTVKCAAHFLPDGAYLLGNSANRWGIYCDVSNAEVLKSVNGRILAGTSAANGTPGTMAMFDAGGKSVGNAPATVTSGNVAFTGTVSADKVRISLADQEYLGTNSSGEIVRGGSPEVQFVKVSIPFPAAGVVGTSSNAIPAGKNATVVGAALTLPSKGASSSTAAGQLWVYYANNNMANVYDPRDPHYDSFGWRAGDEFSILGKQNWLIGIANWIEVVVVGQSVNIVPNGPFNDAGTVIGRSGDAYGLMNEEMKGTPVTITLAVYS